MTPVVRAARTIASDAHAGQSDKAGMPYVDHPRRVAAAVAHLGWEAEAAGWLHDVVEDSTYTYTDLLAVGIPADVVKSVCLLTRRSGVPADDYYLSIRCDPVALAVKLADVADNQDPDRLGRLDPVTRARLRRKYEQATDALVGDRRSHATLDLLP